MPYPPVIHFADFTDPAIPVTRPRKRNFLRRGLFEVQKQLNQVADQWVAIEELEVRAVGTGTRGRTSHSRAHDDIASNSNTRFSFAPIVEELEVHWAVSGEQFIYQMKLELFSPLADGGGRLLWTRTLTWAAGACPANGHVVINGDLTAAPGVVAADAAGVLAGSVIAPAGGLAGAYPEDCLTAEFTTYKLKMTIEDPLGNLTVMAPARWIYLDVRVARIELAWGPIGVLAASPTLGTTPTERDHDVYNKLAVANDPANLGNALPAPGETKRVYLLSNRFYMVAGDLTSNMGYDAHLGVWGTGPNIPLFVSVFLRQSDGTAVAAPRAVGRARFFWEWEDAHLDLQRTGVYAAPAAFPVPVQHGMYVHDMEYVACAVDYNPPPPAPQFHADYPNGKNCHERRGGKRGPNHPNRIFPVQAGYAPQAPLLAHQFPFAVQAGANRTWAAFSDPWGHGDAAAAGKSGAIFSPSRMSGDAYVVHCRMFYAPVNLDQVGANFTQALAALPDAYKASTGRFEVWREVEVSSYSRKVGGIVRAAITQADLDDMFDAAHVKVRLPAPVPTVQAQWDAAMAAALLNLEAFLQAAVDPGVAQHAAGPHGVYFRNHAAFQAEIVHQAGPGGVPAFLGAGVYGAPPNDPYTGTPLWDPNMYANQIDLEGSSGTRIAWPRRILVEMLEHYFVPMPDGICWLDVAELRDPGLGPRGFAVPFRVPQANAAALVLCGDSPTMTASHEIGHLLFLNHVDPVGDPHGYHAQVTMTCLMSYNHVPRRFCGSCLLRLRGWSLHEVNNFANGAYNPAVRTLVQAAAGNHAP